MIKKIIRLVSTVIIFAVLVYLIVSFVRITLHEEEDLLTYLKQRVEVFMEKPGEVIDNFIEERRSSVEEEIKDEVEKAQEGIKGAGESIWDKIGEFIFSSNKEKESDEENNKENEKK